MKSMTGFGECRARLGGERLSISVKSLNHRFVDIKIRAPSEYAVLEPAIIRETKKIIHRGSVEVIINRDVSGSRRSPVFDERLAAQYLKVLKSAKGRLRLKGEIRLDHVLAFPDVWSLPSQNMLEDSLWPAFRTGLGKCLRKLDQMRRREGKALEYAILRDLALFDRELLEIVRQKKRLIQDYEKRLKDRLSSMLGDVPVEPQRLAQEVAFLADRSDIGEELDRLNSHIRQFRFMLKSKKPAGKDLDFLVQEINREINTIGAKIQNTELTLHVIRCKSLMEKIREQIQNVE